MNLKDIVTKAKGLVFEDVGDTLSANGQDLPDDLLKKLQDDSNVTLTQMNQGMQGVNATDIKVNVTNDVIAPTVASTTPATPKAPAAPIINGDKVDFTPIYSEVPPVALNAEAFLKMLADLGDMPLAAKRTVVGTMLNTMSKSTPGVNSASIANDALLKIQVLATYSDNVKNQLTVFLAERNQSINEAKAKIATEEKAIATATERVNKLVTWCEDEGNVLDDVLEFFSTDTPTSVIP